MMDEDKGEYNKAVSQMLSDAQIILSQMGKEVGGTKVYSGKQYSVSQSHDGVLSVVAQDRGVILQVQNNRVTQVNVSKQDFQVFQQFRQRIQSVTPRRYPKAG